MYEKVHSGRLRSWAASECLNQIKADDKFTHCISIGPVSSLVIMQCINQCVLVLIYAQCILGPDLCSLLLMPCRGINDPCTCSNEVMHGN